jgi:ankyrin repeat protein
MLEAAAGLAFINGYHAERTGAERLELVRLLVELGEDVNWADHYGITPLMAAANRGDVPLIQFLVDSGADLGAYDLGKKLDGAFHSSIEPLMAVDYAIGVGTFVPNNSFEYHHEATELMLRLMKEKGIPHTTSECTLRGFTCAIANVDPKTATPAEIAKMRQIQVGFRVEGIAGGLEVKDSSPNR